MSGAINRLLHPHPHHHHHGHDVEGEETPSQDSSVVSAQHSLVYTTESSLYAASTLYNADAVAAAAMSSSSAAAAVVDFPPKMAAGAIAPSTEAGLEQESSQEGATQNNQTKDNLVNEMVKQKLLMLESNDETRL